MFRFFNLLFVFFLSGSLAKCQSKQLPGLFGEWQLKRTNSSANGGRWNADSSRAYIRFNKDSSFGGYDGCNTIAGHFAIQGDQVSIHQETASKMYCSPKKDPLFYGEMIFLSTRFIISGDSLILEFRRNDLPLIKLLLLRPTIRQTGQPLGLPVPKIPEIFRDSEYMEYVKANSPKTPIEVFEVPPGSKEGFIQINRTNSPPGQKAMALHSPTDGKYALTETRLELEWVDIPGDQNKRPAQNFTHARWKSLDVESPLVLFTGLDAKAPSTGIWYPDVVIQRNHPVKFQNQYYHFHLFEDKVSNEGETYPKNPNIYRYRMGKISLVLEITEDPEDHTLSWPGTIEPNRTITIRWIGNLNEDNVHDVLLEEAGNTFLFLSHPGKGFVVLKKPDLLNAPKPGVPANKIPGDLVTWRSGSRDAFAEVVVFLNEFGEVIQKKIRTTSKDSLLFQALDSLLLQLPFTAAMSSLGRIPCEMGFTVSFFDPSLSVVENPMDDQGNPRVKMYRSAIEIAKNRIGEPAFNAWHDPTLQLPGAPDGLPITPGMEKTNIGILRFHLPVSHPQKKSPPYTVYMLRIPFDSLGNPLQPGNIGLPDIPNQPETFHFLSSEMISEIAFSHIPKNLQDAESWNAVSLLFDSSSHHLAWEFQINRIDQYPQGTRMTLRIDAHTGTVLKKETDKNASFRKCLPADAGIETLAGIIPVSQIQEGMLVYTQDESKNKILMPVIKIDSVKVPIPHKMLRFTFSDGSSITASEGHPMPCHKTFRDVGTEPDSSRRPRGESVDYRAGKTYDLLPDGPTGIYFIGQVPVASTLFERNGEKDSAYASRLEKHARELIALRLGTVTTEKVIFTQYVACAEAPYYQPAHRGSEAYVRFQWKPRGKETKSIYEFDLHFDNKGFCKTDLAKILPDCNICPACCEAKSPEDWAVTKLGESMTGESGLASFDGNNFYRSFRKDFQVSFPFRFIFYSDKVSQMNLCTGEVKKIKRENKFLRLPMHIPDSEAGIIPVKYQYPFPDKSFLQIGKFLLLE